MLIPHQPLDERRSVCSEHRDIQISDMISYTTGSKAEMCELKNYLKNKPIFGMHIKKIAP
jgi:hypothetical protein